LGRERTVRSGSDASEHELGELVPARRRVLESPDRIEHISDAEEGPDEDRCVLESAHGIGGTSRSSPECDSGQGGEAGSEHKAGTARDPELGPDLFGAWEPAGDHHVNLLRWYVGVVKRCGELSCGLEHVVERQQRKLRLELGP
jgi:hypothetical protein